jgi:hypothetical protein
MLYNEILGLLGLNSPPSMKHRTCRSDGGDKSAYRILVKKSVGKSPCTMETGKQVMMMDDGRWM